MAQIYPYLSFENAKEALEYYEEFFGATNIRRVKVEPNQAEEFNVPLDKIDDATMHAEFRILGAELYCSDSFGNDVGPTRQISIMLDVNWEDEKALKESNDFFDKLAKSGQVEISMPYEEQFWGGKMGQFVDKYGITWMLHAQPYSEVGKA